MGLFSIIRLASDYAKAKRFVEDKIADKKVDIEKIKAHVEKLKGFIEYLKGMEKEVKALVAKAKELYNALVKKLEELKAKEEGVEE